MYMYNVGSKKNEGFVGKCYISIKFVHFVQNGSFHSFVKSKLILHIICTFLTKVVLCFRDVELNDVYKLTGLFKRLDNQRKNGCFRSLYAEKRR
jgi:hypothetical protein